jgi:hypothetical protein
VKVGVMSGTPRTVLRPNVGTTPEQARDARARAWAFIFSCHAKRKAAEAGGRDEAKGPIDARPAKPILPR